MTRYFEEIEDTRQQGKVKYNLAEVIVLTITAVTAGALYEPGKVNKRYSQR